MGTMSEIAAGAYLRRLRQARGLTIERVAELSQTSVSQISRIETGGQNTRAPLMFRVARTLRASLEDLETLLLGDETAEEAVRRAELLLSHESQELISHLVESVSDDQRDSFQQVLESLSPEKIQELIRYGRYLEQSE